MWLTLQEYQWKKYKIKQSKFENINRKKSRNEIVGLFFD